LYGTTLRYACGPTKILRGDVVDEKTRRYVPPFDEFQLETIALGPNDVYDVAVSKGPCVYLVREGGGTVNGTTGTEAMEAKRGGVFFSSAGEAVRFAASAEGMRAHRAMINDWVFSDVPRPPKWKENDVEGWRAYEHGRREDDDEYA
jgi:mannose-6-phosphate isomerase